MILCRLLHCVGHVAQWQIIHCEHSIHNHKRKLLSADKEEPESKVSNELVLVVVSVDVVV